MLSALADARASFGIAIKELRTGRGLLLNENEEMYAASLFKLPLMYEAFSQWSSGRLQLSETLTLTERHLEFDLGTLDRGAGQAYSVGQALERMISISDNAAAILLQDRVEAWRANQSVRQLGLKHTFVLNERLTTSAYDMAVLLEHLARGTAVSPQASAAMVQLLLGQKINDRLPALLPKGTPVAHKTGNWDAEVHDVGIIYAPHATLVIAVLSSQVSDRAAATRAIAQVALECYEHFERLAPGSLGPPPSARLAYPVIPPLPPTPLADPA